MVDATVTTPCLARGVDLGADIVIHSTSKFINGTGNAIGGAIVDMGTFDWESAKFPNFAQFVKKYSFFAFTARARKLIHKDLGACAAPMNSFLLSEGIETLGLRMERHCFNALELACFLNDHDKVAWVNYPGLKENAGFATAKRLYNNKYGGILTIGLPDRVSAFRFINSLRLVKNLANIGDAKTLVIHPASTICSDFGPEEKALMGVGEEMVRVSVGIEAIEDIVEDFRAALETI
jgi:O-acetylhomoserine (thiol)-lyase